MHLLNQNDDGAASTSVVGADIVPTVWYRAGWRNKSVSRKFAGEGRDCDTARIVKSTMSLICARTTPLTSLEMNFILYLSKTS